MSNSNKLDIISGQKAISFFRNQETGPTLVITGPSGSSKSTILTEVLPRSSNKLLSRNIGVKQTSLVDTKLMLNERLPKDLVCIRCKKKQLDFVLLKSEFIDAITEYIYKHRDELEDFDLDIAVVEKILNPVNRAYHLFEYVKEKQSNQYQKLVCPSIKDLHRLLTNLCNVLINIPIELDEAINNLVKESKTITPKPKKQDLYKQEISRRLSTNESQTSVGEIYDWFEQLYEYILGEISMHFSDRENLILYSNIKEDCVENLIGKIYDKNSPFSLVFEEVAYAVCPSEEFIATYKSYYSPSDYPGKILKLNLLDTPGLTQTSDEKEDISSSLDKILTKQFDAVLFLCSTDEKPTVYDNCIDLMLSKKILLLNKPLVIVRTKADITLREKMISYLRLEEGTSALENTHINTYAQRAYDELVAELDLEGETLAKEDIINGSDKLIDFISLAPDLMNKMNDTLKQPLRSNKIYHILINLSLSVHKCFMPDQNGRLWIQSVNSDEPALQCTLDGYLDEFLDSFADFMVNMNAKHSNQYLKWVNSRYPFHGRSVTTFIWKHRLGIGHETNANVYENFKVYIRNMINRWMQEFFKDWDVNFEIDFRNLVVTNDSGVQAVNEGPTELTKLFKLHKLTILNSISKLLSYDELEKEFTECYKYNSWDNGFRKNMNLFSKKFSDKVYWKNGLKKHLKLELDILLEKMYFSD